METECFRIVELWWVVSPWIILAMSFCDVFEHWCMQKSQV